jgi:hypothetical protein
MGQKNSRVNFLEPRPLLAATSETQASVCLSRGA